VWYFSVILKNDPLTAQFTYKKTKKKLFGNKSISGSLY